jgi:hypothetical protein
LAWHNCRQIKIRSSDAADCRQWRDQRTAAVPLPGNGAPQKTPQFLSLKSFEYVAMLCQPFCRVEMRHIQILDRLDQFFWRVNDHDKATTAQLLDHCRSREPSETVLGTVVIGRKPRRRSSSSIAPAEI